jgi:hypothetical protein
MSNTVFKEKEFGYYFNGRFYKTIEELRGKTMTEDNQPIPLYRHPQPEITEEEKEELCPYETRPEVTSMGFRTIWMQGFEAALSKLKGE